MRRQPFPPLNEATVKSMKSNKWKDTSPEIALRKALRDAGYPGYRLQWKIPGRPDICYPGRKVAIFVNGCFWHRCPYCNLPMPKHNSDFWRSKFERNVARDAKSVSLLESDGWTVITVWECQIRGDIGQIVEKIVSFL